MRCLEKPQGDDRGWVRRTTLHCAVLLVAWFAAAACSNGYVPTSDTGDANLADGTAERRDAGTDPDDTMTTPQDGGSADSAASGVDSGQDGVSSTCTPEGDGKIGRDEVPLQAGLKAIFRVAQGVTVDTAGQKKSGERHWDYTKSYSGDHAEAIELQSMDGKWFKADFPDADYAMKLTGDSEELGVFDITSDALLMLGVVSPTDESTTTNIEYDPAVKVFDFPLEEGKTWKTEATATGTHATWSPWTPITYQETYRNQVDAAGTLETPYGEFDVLRVRTVLERSQAVSGVPLGTIRTFAFVAECFGTVATIRSKQGESKTEFDEASEIRRLSK